jgi:hypothetical protein
MLELTAALVALSSAVAAIVFRLWRQGGRDALIAGRRWALLTFAVSVIVLIVVLSATQAGAGRIVVLTVQYLS